MMERHEGYPLPTESIPWDLEERHDLLPKVATIRDNLLFLTAPLLAWMEQVWGYFTFVRTRTFIDTGEVWLAAAAEYDPGAIELKRVGTQNSAYINFWRPLRKLNIQMPADRQFDLVPRLIEVNEQLKVFSFQMSDRKSRPRDVGAATEAAVTAEAAVTQVAAATETTNGAGDPR